MNVQNDARTNSLDMKMQPVKPGTFRMGSASGEPDEQPVHSVRITRPFFMAATPVTNAQYELFEPEHRRLRGKRGLSREDDEAVVFVSWQDAIDFCDWLSEREGQPYRLPTEAEWEFACRAGTTTPYHTGEELPEPEHRAQEFNWDPVEVPMTVGSSAPNPRGLHDMHGLVEEWCLDWYGRYSSADQVDPAGPDEGVFKVTRGGSHNTDVQFLRSSCRLGTLPEDRSWVIGFRVVQAEDPGEHTSQPQSPKAWQSDVTRVQVDWSAKSAGEKAVFESPTPFVIPPGEGSSEPFYPHNHCPSITWCDNGDLLAIWFSTINEGGREMTILASRRRVDAEGWEPASEFFNVPGRNLTGSSLFNNGEGTLFHFNGLGVTEGWANLAMVLRTSEDNGASWSRPRLIQPEHRRGHQVISGTSMTAGKTMIQPCDAVWSGSGGTVIHLSRDGGLHWSNPADETLETTFAEGERGNRIAGIHAGVVPLKDGRLFALGRDDNIDGRMPVSISEDQGRSWHYAASEFPPLAMGQRLVLMRLREGPILLVSFTDPSSILDAQDGDEGLNAGPTGMVMRNGAGEETRVYGMFAALSYDEGRTWPVKRLVAPAEGQREMNGGAWTGEFTLSPISAETKGYLAATQSPDGIIHLISSRLHYRFNLSWIENN